MNQPDEKLVLLKSLGWSDELLASVKKCDGQNLSFVRVEDPFEHLVVRNAQETSVEIRPIFSREVIARS